MNSEACHAINSLVGVRGTESLLSKKKVWIEWNNGEKRAVIEGVDNSEGIFRGKHL
jgi:hypothetical protein